MTATTFPSPLRELVGPWVETRRERRGDGSQYVVAVNHRDGRSMIVDEDELELVSDADARTERAELLEVLRADGFLLDRPAELDTGRPSPGLAERITGCLRTLQVPWAGADRAVRWFHRSGGRHLFHPIAVVLQVLLAVAGTVAIVHVLTSGSPVVWRAEPWMLPALLAIDLVAITIHELGHALVLVHHGRSVRSAGFALHLGTPAFYVETVDGLLLPRRTRVLQVLAGPWAEWLATGAAALIALQLPEGAAALVLHRFIVLNAITVGSNLLPFVGLDGYWLLSDGLREPDPSARAARERAAARDELRAGRLPNARTLGWASWGIANRSVAGGLILLSCLFWYQRFGGLIAGAIDLGPLAAVAVLTALLALARPMVASARPHLALACHRATAAAARVRFRTERGWRSEAAESLRHHPALHGLDEVVLGVIAGRLVHVTGGQFDGISVDANGRRVGLPQTELDWILGRVGVRPQRAVR